MVLVPKAKQDHGRTPAGPADPGGTWVFPFDKPLPPAPGDNQAAAYNTTDGSIKYDVAFALVWATGDEVYNVNEAHAYASCSHCVTVAVAFQVLLIMNNAHVIVPQNLAVAANYDCYQCITAAIASQLVLSVEKTPGDQQLLAIGQLWNRLTAFGHSITSFSLTEISAQLEAVKSQIVAILGDAPPVPVGGNTTSTASPDGTSTGQTDQASPSATGSSTTSPTASGQTAAPESPSSTSSGGAPSTDGSTSSQPTSSPTAAPLTDAPSPTEPTTTPSSSVSP